MRKQFSKQAIGVLGAATIAAGVIAAAPAAGAATPTARTPQAEAQPASSVGGSIKRSETLSRAHYWLGKGIVYNMNGSHRDPQGRSYRTDCSGYVSMALHLGSSLSTVTLPGVGHKISKKSLAAGDYIGHMGAGTGGAGGHVRLFAKWSNKAHTRYYAYDFGSTPVKYQTYPISTSGYTAYRYNHIKAG